MSKLKAQIMLVDDHPMMRQGMAMLINMEPDLEVSAEAGDGKEALSILKKNNHIDIVLLDVTLKTVSGFEVIKSIHIFNPDLPVLLFRCMMKRFMLNVRCARVRVAMS